MEKRSFVWGVLAALLAIIFVFLVTLIIATNLLNTPFQTTLILLTFAIIIIAIMLEIGVFIYYITDLRGDSESSYQAQLHEKEIRLEAVESAKEEIEHRYYNREMAKDTYQGMMHKFEEESTELRSEIEALREQVDSNT